jgi:hypothetical protein
LEFRNLQEKLEKCTYSEERNSLAVSTLSKVLAKHFINWYIIFRYCTSWVFRTRINLTAGRFLAEK